MDCGKGGSEYFESFCAEGSDKITKKTQSLIKISIVALQGPRRKNLKPRHEAERR